MDIHTSLKYVQWLLIFKKNICLKKNNNITKAHKFISIDAQYQKTVEKHKNED